MSIQLGNLRCHCILADTVVTDVGKDRRFANITAIFLQNKAKQVEKQKIFRKYEWKEKQKFIYRG